MSANPTPLNWSMKVGESSESIDTSSIHRTLSFQLQELRGNIRVFFRCRYDSRTPCCLQFPSDTDVMPPNAKKPFKFDKVFTPKSTQEEVIRFSAYHNNLHHFSVPILRFFVGWTAACQYQYQVDRPTFSSIHKTLLDYSISSSCLFMGMLDQCSVRRRNFF